MKRRSVRSLLVAAAFCAGAFALALAESVWPFAQRFAMARFSGWIAFIGLALGLSITPLAHFAPLRRLRKWRRSVGISTAFAASVHLVASLLGPLDGAWRAVFSWNYLLAGALAFAVLALLFVTSFPSAVRRMGLRHWKVLHRLVYAAALLVAAHLFLSPWGNVSPKGIGGGLIFALFVARWPARRVTKRRRRPE